MGGETILSDKGRRMNSGEKYNNVSMRKDCKQQEQKKKKGKLQKKSVGFAGFMSGTGVFKLRAKSKMNTACRGEHMALQRVGVSKLKIWGQLSCHLSKWC